MNLKIDVREAELMKKCQTNIEMFSNMEKTAEKYSNVSEFEKTVCDLFSDHQVKRAEIFENQLKKLQNN